MSQYHGHPEILAILPSPVLVMVLEQLEDLASLHSAYRASPAVFSVLHEEGTARRVIEAIMDLSLPDMTQVLIRKFAHLRWNFRPLEGVDTFIKQYITDDTEYTQLPREIPLPVLCDVLAASSTVRYLAHVGMHEMIDRCMASEMYRLENPKLKYIRNVHRTPSLWVSEYFPVPKPPRERYQQADAGPPSAIEEQMAIRALWQLILIWELRSAVSGPNPRWNWPASEVSKLQGLYLDEIWQHSLTNQLIEQTRTMADCSCMFPGLSSPVERYRAAKSLARRADWQFPCHCSPPSAFRIKSIDPNDMNYNMPGYSFVLTTLSPWYTSPCRYVEFRSFRRFGFAIWDRTRMAALGLLYPDKGSPKLPQSPRSESDQYVRWESILSAEDLEDIERKRKHFWPGMEMVHLESAHSISSMTSPFSSRSDHLYLY
ncbi:hypothetical protein BO94DRAFT_624305 [Aspergillus sclerotioniger CBS 115572]|uniref:F-box domain-containing protein n=1 Tax=Aspergillus sclerotioniger CBS 115572 TaxID=1450535 RepID=A0A317WM27_9EURO|nr:hypothetical protein BO94DRAFT_624305 [Aspergillus sclerotioniger CBS 115572]PWY87095.1 hypothetical protein BO94DRAFT_624305 [Aspergillus sclerotioniger CBS 115572]